MSSGYAVGGYTRADLDALLGASDKLNEHKQKIGRLLAAVTYLIKDELQFHGGLINKKVPFEIGSDDYFIWVRADNVAQMLLLEIGKIGDFEKDEFISRFKLRTDKRHYIVEEIPLLFVMPLYQNLPKVFDAIQDYNDFGDLKRKMQWMITCANLEVKVQEVAAIFRQSVEEIPLNVPLYNKVKNGNIQTVYELVTKTAAELTRMKLFGERSLREIKEVLASKGLHLGMTQEEVLLWTPPDSAKSLFVFNSL